MMNVSREFRDMVNNGVRIVNYADITLKDGTILNLTPEDFSLTGFSMVDETTDGKFGIGNAIGKTIDITIANHTDQYSLYDFYKAIIHMYIAVHAEDGRVLRERKGKYYVINSTSPGDAIKISGVDSMYLFDKPYDAMTVFPATLQTILSDCCVDCGVNIGFGEFDNWNFVVDNKPEDSTYREVVSYTAQLAGYNARINNDDALELVWYDAAFIDMDIYDGGKLISYNEGDIYDGGDFTERNQQILIDGGNFTDPLPTNVTKISSLTVSTDNIVISGVKVETDSNNYVINGTEEYLLTIKDNPFTTGKEREIADYIAGRVIGLTFRPMQCQIANNPFFEPFDACYVYDRKGNFYFSLINSVKYKIGGFTTIACKAEDPVRNESSYFSESAKAAAQAKKNMEMQFSTYEKAAQNMDMLAANAMGLYRESEKKTDGSYIYYQSNRPITKNNDGRCEFEENSVVYKMTGDGFFVSSDGGISFTAGFDSNGNAVINVLSAIGITFDWARGGTITLGGEDNIDGKASVFDKDKNHLGSWDNMGFWTKSADYKKESGISHRALVHPGCGDINNSASFRIIGSEGAERVSLKEISILKDNGITDSYLSEPSGYIDETYPYWDFNSTGILVRVQISEQSLQPGGSGEITVTGYIKRILCHQNDVLIYDRDFTKYSPASGVYADLRNGFFHNKTWKIEDGNVFKNNSLMGQSMLLANTIGDSYEVVTEDPEDFYKFSSLVLVTEHKTNGNIVNISTFSTAIFRAMKEGAEIRNGTQNYSSLKFDGYIEQVGIDPGIKMHLTLSSSSTSYYAKLYGVV